MNLARHLQDQALRHPQARQLVVAHSHGGNVTLQTLKHLAGAIPEMLIATIAAPFTQVDPRAITKTNTTSRHHSRDRIDTNTTYYAFDWCDSGPVEKTKPEDQFSRLEAASFLFGVVASIVVAFLALKRLIFFLLLGRRCEELVELTRRFFTGSEKLVGSEPSMTKLHLFSRPDQSPTVCHTS